MALRRWLDRLLGRTSDVRTDGTAATAAARKEQEEARKSEADEPEERAHEARDEVVRREPMPPPGTG